MNNRPYQWQDSDFSDSWTGVKWRAHVRDIVKADPRFSGLNFDLPSRTTHLYIHKPKKALYDQAKIRLATDSSGFSAYLYIEKGLAESRNQKQILDETWHWHTLIELIEKQGLLNQFGQFGAVDVKLDIFRRQNRDRTANYKLVDGRLTSGSLEVISASQFCAELKGIDPNEWGDLFIGKRWEKAELLDSEKAVFQTEVLSFAAALVPIYLAVLNAASKSQGIPATTREDILAALARFDRELRNTAEWDSWETRGNHKYAISHNDRLYPVKQIISMATGAARVNFTGGNQANRYIEGYGFTVISLGEKTRYWKIAPGENAWNWDACLKGEYISMGWDDFGDISSIAHEDFKAKRVELEAQAMARGDTGWGEEGVGQLWRFAHALNEGDKIVANKGTKQIIGVGTVTGKYYFVAGQKHGHRLPVAWEDTRLRGIDEPGWRRTLIELDKKKFDELTGGKTLFTEQSFALLAGLRETPTRDFYNSNKADIKALVEEPLNSLIKAVAQRISMPIKNTMETERRIMSRILKNDYGQGGAWSHYWGAFYPNGGKRTEDAQLFCSINKDCLRFGFYIGEYGTASMERFTRNCRENQKALQNALEPSLSAENLVFGKENGEKANTPKLIEAATIGWREWLRNPDEYGICVAVQLSSSEVADKPADDLIAEVVGTFERLFPLVLLATDADPMPVIAESVDETKDINPEYTCAQLAADTFFELKEVERWVHALERKKQVILYGPPGTGKTYLAEHLARHVIGGGDGFSEVIQFHPAYAYEDFMQGIRPESDGEGNLTYPLVPGRFLSFCQRALTRTGKCVLIIDEVNRANLSRVFGELMYLLEYRKKEVPLAGGRRFTIPDNVRIIGTMNTADRSIALVDHALRRRFAFLALYPNYDVIRAFHANTGFSTEGLVETLKRLNQEIGDRHYEIGTSFFLDPDLGANVEDIWRMEIEPYLEEYFFDRPDKAADFGWDKISPTILP